MLLQLGEKIKALRKSRNITQENLASVLGITAQAVSRWELGSAYPDVEMIPSLANYFGVSIDELFGCECERNKKIDKIIARVGEFGIKARGDGKWVEECLAILREGLAEFPQNERLTITLAETLYEAGGRIFGERHYYSDEGFLMLDCGAHRKNEYWTEAAKLCGSIAETSRDSKILTRAIRLLVILHRNFGEYEKAAEYAAKMPSLESSREMLLAVSADGKDAARYIGAALLKTVSEFSELVVQGVMADRRNYDTDVPIEKINGLISLFGTVFSDGNFGEYSGRLIQLYLYLSWLQWERGYRDEAFVSLYNALKHARALEKFLDGEERYFTAPLISLVKCRAGEPVKIAASLPEDWPFYCCPNHSAAETEIKADPRWTVWVEKCGE